MASSSAHRRIRRLLAQLQQSVLDVTTCKYRPAVQGHAQQHAEMQWWAHVARGRAHEWARFTLQQPGVVARVLRRFTFLRQARRRHFSLIEVLVAIAIAVMMSGMAVTAYMRRIQDGLQSSALLELASIQQAITAFYFRREQYPNTLQDLVDAGDLVNIMPDPWGHEYIYIPPFSWSRVLRVCQDPKAVAPAELQALLDWLKRLVPVLESSVSLHIEPLVLLTVLDTRPVLMSSGYSHPVLLPDALRVPVERTQTVLRLIRQARELATGHAELSALMEPVAAAAARLPGTAGLGSGPASESGEADGRG